MSNNTNQKNITTKKLFIHIDADAFFASVEQCIHHELRGKPVVAGRNGSMVVAVSYEAKKIGVIRGLPAHEILRDYHGVYVVASDYTMYQIFSDRMLAITKRYLPTIARNSIDEMHARIDTCDDAVPTLLEQLHLLQNELEIKLGIGFSLGVGLTRTIAKIASAMEKPHGFTHISDARSNVKFLQLPIEKVPGFGRQTSPRLRKLGIATIEQFLNWYPKVADNFSITMQERYDELSGIPRQSVVRNRGQSINRARSFKVTTNYLQIWGQASENINYLARKLRANQKIAQQIYLTLRDTNRRGYTKRIKLLTPTNDFFVLQEHTQHLFSQLYIPEIPYRYVSITLSGIQSTELQQKSLFHTDSNNEQKNSILWSTIDKVNSRNGFNAVYCADTMIKPRELGSHLSSHHPMIIEQHQLLPNEQAWRRLNYPFLGKIK